MQFPHSTLATTIYIYIYILVQRRFSFYNIINIIICFTRTIVCIVYIRIHTYKLQSYYIGCYWWIFEDCFFCRSGVIKKKKSLFICLFFCFTCSQFSAWKTAQESVVRGSVIGRVGLALESSAEETPFGKRRLRRRSLRKRTFTR